MKLSRRALLKATFGAAQLALLQRSGLLGRRAFAEGAGDAEGPSRMLTLYMPGGYHPLSLFCPLSAADIGLHIPEPVGFFGERVFHTAEDVVDLAPAQNGHSPIRIVRTWDPVNPASRMIGDQFRSMPLGYAWKQFNLHEQLAVVHGVDHRTPSHLSGYISAMSGAAGPDYRAPAMQCVVANALLDRFPNRPLPCVALDPRGVPQALNLPGRSSPILVPSLDNLNDQLSDAWWDGLNMREERPAFDFQGNARGTLPLTHLESHTALNIRSYRGTSNASTDSWLGRLHDGLQNVGSLLARDVVTELQRTLGVEYLPEGCLYGGQDTGYQRFGFHFGRANPGGNGSYDASFDMALRLMKSDLASSIHLRMPKHSYDTHNNLGHRVNHLWLRGEMDVIGRFLGEMKQTPAPNRPGKTLLEDTLVVIFSEFSRTWPKWGDDHWPITSTFFVGGGIGANRGVGGFDTGNLGVGGPLGMPVDIFDRGEVSRRVPTSADTVTTALKTMGLRPGRDFTIPGAHGEILGVRA